ncbi:hypothetical protein BRN76_18000 [Xanthomonas oryzae pv. oryzae]|nr:hypothetical protein BRO16_02460 [Xanthomonas oryzae pv. oryzae]RBA70358.1 hypothetical protein BRN68_16235 [Xanthomonas oryzae pv. oryzae]RBA82934.1 hypothetical protein BRO15_19260 [Xanthomonas oryzae pv. oryzae]RBA91438.1 hypothetical protein BRN79_10780 [Xanthomonas oryzae pv. oryzae]RBB00901.1 hypothetical protein BRN69_13550 [Xanthomonas oryzae pv. oryzae]
MPRWPSDWLGLSPEASHTARVAGSHRTNGFVFSNTVELVKRRYVHMPRPASDGRKRWHHTLLLSRIRPPYPRSPCQSRSGTSRRS